MEYKLEDICLKITDGSHYSPIADINGNIPMLSVKDMEEFDFNYNNCKHISEEEYDKMLRTDCVPKLYDVLVAKDGSYLKEIFVNEEENKKAILSSIAIFRPNLEMVDPYFLCYLLKTPMILNYVKDNCVSGSALPRIILRAFKNIKLTIPELKIQRKIVRIIKSINTKIRINNEINNNLYEEAVALYKDKFKGIGQGKKTIGDYIVPKRGKNLLTRDAIDGDTPVVAGGIAPSAYHNQFNTKSPVITISASGANAGYTNLWAIPVWASDCSYIDDSITKNVYFWYIVLKTRQNEIFDAQTGSAQPHIYPQHIAEMSIGELDIAKVEKYNNLVAPLFKMIGENQKENKKLSQLRDTLLPKLMNGEIDLDNIES